MPKINKAHTTSNFRRKIRMLPEEIKKVAVVKILLFENNFLHPSLNTHKLKGPLKNFWSFYANDKYRILFRFLANSEVIYYDIDDHDIYKK